MPEQLFVAVNLERVDRGLPALRRPHDAALDENAQRGADDANDPPDPGQAYDLDDAEWAGGSSNGLDAVYGWMYDDGFDSGNLDCVHRGAAGLLGAPQRASSTTSARVPTWRWAPLSTRRGDTHNGDAGGTSMAVTLAVAAAPARSLLFSWAQVAAALPAGAP